MSPKHSFRPSSKLLRRSKELLVRNWMHSNSSGPGPACGDGNNRDTGSCPGQARTSVSVFTHLGSRYKGSSLTAPGNRAGNVVLRRMVELLVDAIPAQITLRYNDHHGWSSGSGVLPRTAACGNDSARAWQVYGRGGIPGCERRHRKIPKRRPNAHCNAE